ncbi:amyloid-beta A4 precursor protein-binding family B member 3 isoform X2 [Amblyraja radiata]|uniref:amyloid-beta A4 precursor protein-binding family B member 3 isoform X2 n=1 Tax=Amblyraja radiata TaxID=386614 RepID=UPI0014031A43|nr:amyloid-beta A4 precursor protein-binding family B member 3 isoform X2 [Amblyraja radiata]
MWRHFQSPVHQRAWSIGVGPDPDNLWNDPSLETDPELPTGWRTIRDSSGTYYWHVPTGATQWHHPAGSPELGVDAGKLPSAVVPALGHKPQVTVSGPTAVNHPCRGGTFESKMPASSSINLRDPLLWQDGRLEHGRKLESKCFAVRSLGWVEIPEEDLAPGKSSIAVNNCIQQLSSSKSAGRRSASTWEEGQDMVLVLRKDTLSLVDPIDHSLIHSQPIINIRVWGVGCTHGRDFAYVASDKDTCMLKCHVFHCDTPAKAIASALHQISAQIMSERALRSDSTIAPGPEEDGHQVDLTRQVDLLHSVTQRTQRFRVQYIGCLPVGKSIGMKQVNEVIRSLLGNSEQEVWPSVFLRVTDTTLSICKGEDGEEPWWECPVRYLTFLGVGKDPHTVGVIVDIGRQRFKCHVFWCEPDAGCVSEAVQTACMLQYQRCLVTSSPRQGPRRGLEGPPPVGGLRKHGCPLSAGPPESPPPAPKLLGGSGLKRGVLALIDSLQHKPSALQMP